MDCVLSKIIDAFVAALQRDKRSISYINLLIISLTKVCYVIETIEHEILLSPNVVP